MKRRLYLKTMLAGAGVTAIAAEKTQHPIQLHVDLAVDPAKEKEMLHNFYKKSWDSWQKGLTQAPYAFLIPADQGDPARVAQMVGRLMAQHIEISRAESAIQLRDGSYPAGTYVVRLDQPYRNYAVDLLTPQHYPKDGEPPYDDVSWELPANYHLQALPTADNSIRDAALTILKDPPRVAGRVTGTGPAYLLKDTGQESFLAERYRLANFEIQIAEHEFEQDGVRFPAGSWILSDQPGLHDAIEIAASELGLDFIRASACGFPGLTPTRSDGFAIPSTSARCRTPICATKTFAREISARKSTFFYMAMSISNSPSRSRGCPEPGRRCHSRKRRRRPVSGRRLNPTTSPEASAMRAWRRFSDSSKMAA